MTNAKNVHVKSYLLEVLEEGTHKIFKMLNMLVCSYHNSLVSFLVV